MALAPASSAACIAACEPAGDIISIRFFIKYIFSLNIGLFCLFVKEKTLTKHEKYAIFNSIFLGYPARKIAKFRPTIDKGSGR